MLSLKKVMVHYGGVQALKGISLTAEQGAITCLIGANGAGKSTTLRAISGLVPLTTGEIRFENRRINGMAPEEIVALGIGHVPEGKKLFLEMNVRDNLLTGAYLRTDKAAVERDLKRICSHFPVLGTAIGRPASQMSGGEQQMLAIGRGLMCAPKLLLLDEPSLGLSPLLTREVGNIIRQIAAEGVSILLIEQNASLALQLARKCYVLETGRIALEGTGAELQNNDHVKVAYLGLSSTSAVSDPGVVRQRAPAVQTAADVWSSSDPNGSPIPQTPAAETPSRSPAPTAAAQEPAAATRRLDRVRFDLGQSHRRPDVEERTRPEPNSHLRSGPDPSSRIIQRVFKPDQR